MIYPHFDPEQHVIVEHKVRPCMSAAHFISTKRGVRPRGWYLLSRRAWKHARQVNKLIALMLDPALLDALSQQLHATPKADGPALAPKSGAHKERSS